MLQKILRILPEPVKHALKAVKQKAYDQPSKKRLFKRMQIKHSELLKEVKGKDKIKVVFLAIHKSVWKVEPVFQQMLKDPLFEPIILVCPYTPYGDERMWQDMEETYEHFKIRNYPVLLSYNKSEQRWITLDELSPNIVFFTNPYNLTRKEYYEDAYLNHLTLYVPYYFMATKHAGDENTQFNSQFFASIWKVYWPNDYCKRCHTKLSVSKGENGLAVGYPAVEGLLKNERLINTGIWKSQPHNLKKIIFAPHHTIDDSKNSLSSFLIFGEFIKHLAVKYKTQVQWSFKPHPILKSKLYEHPCWGKDKTDSYYNFWQEQSFTQFDNGDYEELFLSSDAIIHDCSSFIVEYAFTNNPSLYLLNNNNLKGLLNEFGEGVMQTYQQAKTKDEICSFIEDVISGTISFNTNKRSYFNDYVTKYYKDKLPSERIIEDIKKSLGALSVH